MPEAASRKSTHNSPHAQRNLTHLRYTTRTNLQNYEESM